MSDEEKLVIVENKPIPLSETKTTFAFNNVGGETPRWAKMVFRITFLLTTIATAYIAATDLMSDHTKYEVTLVLKLILDPLVFGVSKMFGIDVKDVG